MLKKSISFVIVIILFVTASCTPRTTPQSKYATDMQAALELLTKWQNDYANLESLLTDPLDPNTGVTRLQMIELYNIAIDEYHITRDEYFKLGLDPLDALVGPSTNLSAEGQKILDILSTVVPVEEIQAEHQIVLECVQTRDALVEELSSSLKDLDSIDMNKAGDLNACEPLDSSLDKITVFVNENK